MKNNRKIQFMILFAVLLLVVIGFFFYNKNQNKSNNIEQNISQSELNIKPIDSNNTELPNSISTSNVKGAPPKWAESLMEINNNLTYSREDKIKKLVNLLKENESNPQAINDILIALTKFNPIEAADDIIPYLNHSNPMIQSAALGVLNNASLLTKKEHELKHSLPENDEVRKHISDAVNKLKTDPKTSKDVKQAIISTYSATNPSQEDNRKMREEILGQQKITDNEASYIANSVLNGNDLTESLNNLNHKDAVIKDSVISSMGANIIDNPNITTILSTQQKSQLIEFIRQNPPSSSGDNFGFQNDQWKNTLNVLSNNM